MVRISCYRQGVSLLLGCGLLVVAGAAQAKSVSYRLLDHGGGALGPNYGLRLDQIAPPTGNGPIFSTSSDGAFTTLTYDADALPALGRDASLSAVIEGTLWLPDLNDAATGELWDVKYTLTDLERVDDPDGIGFQAYAGNGSLTNGTTTYNLVGKPSSTNNPVFRFAFDGHRLSGDDASPVGRGWINPMELIPGVNFEQDGRYNDWLVRAVPIPAEVVTTPSPSAALFGAIGIAALTHRRRRRSVN